MAVTPKDVQEKLSEEERLLIDRAEGKIDAMLMNERYTIAVSELSNILGLNPKDRLVNALLARYSKHCKVELVRDDRDGDYYNFSPG